MIGAPVGIALVAGVAIPSMIIGIPIWVGRKIHRKMIFTKRYKRNVAVISGVTGAVLVSPAVAALVVGQYLGQHFRREVISRDSI